MKTQTCRNLNKKSKNQVSAKVSQNKNSVVKKLDGTYTTLLNARMYVQKKRIILLKRYRSLTRYNYCSGPPPGIVLLLCFSFSIINTTIALDDVQCSLFSLNYVWSMKPLDLTTALSPKSDIARLLLLLVLVFVLALQPYA